MAKSKRNARKSKKVTKENQTDTINSPTVLLSKPTLVQCGRHLINPMDVRCITRVRTDLYVVKFLSESQSQFPCWVERKYITKLLEHFNIIVDDTLQSRESDLVENIVPADFWMSDPDNM